MPKRTTINFSSEDAKNAGEQQLTVHYCRFCGSHLLILDTPLRRLPRRRTDGALCVPPQSTYRLIADDGDSVLLDRGGGAVERQRRANCKGCGLWVAYRVDSGVSPPPHSDPTLFIVDGALAADAAAAAGAPPVPPCITATDTGLVQVALEVEEGAPRTALSRLGAESIALAVCDDGPGLLEFLARVLGLLPRQVSLGRGGGGRSRLLLVEGATTAGVFGALRAELARAGGAGGGGD